MRHPRILLALLAASSPASTVCAFAQSAEDVIVMRRVVAPPKRAPAGTPTPTQSGYAWVTSEWIANPSCSAKSEQTRLVGCVKDGTTQVADELCPAPKPDTSRVQADYSTCDLSWVVTGQGAWANGCSLTDTRPLTAVCRRSDGTDVADEACSSVGPKPSMETGSSADSCTYGWSVGEYGSYSSTCNAVASRSRLVSCRRSDGTVVQDELCPGVKPASEDVSANFSGCSYSWAESPWGASSSSCSTAATQTRARAQCIRSDASRTSVDPSFCDAASEPPVSRVVEDLSGCTYSWIAGDYGEWSSTCSTAARRTRDVVCNRADGTRAASDDLCREAKPDEEESAAVLSGCTFDWIEGQWSTPASCSANVVQTRSVSCRRSDGLPQPDSACDPGKRPSTSQPAPVGDFSTCSYEWKATPFSAYTSTCGDGLTRTRRVYCLRSDGQEVGPASCASLGEAPPESDVSSNYSGCSTAWSEGGFGAWSSTCSATATRDQDVTCVQQRPTGPVAVDDALCPSATKPGGRQTAAVYTGCTAVWATGNFVADPRACSASAVDTRSVTCTQTRPDGSTFTAPSESLCTAAKPAATQPAVSPYAGCSYNWVTGGYGAWSSTCSASATQSQTADCMRSTTPPTVVGDDFCGSQVTASPRIQGPVQNVTDCGGVLTNGGFESTPALSGFTLGSSDGGANMVLRTKVQDYHVRTGSNSLGGPRLSNSRTVWAEQVITTKPGVTYSLSGWMATGNNTTLSLAWKTAPGAAGSVISSVNSNTLDYNFKQYSVTATATSTSMVVRLQASGGIAILYAFDDVIVTVSAIAP